MSLSKNISVFWVTLCGIMILLSGLSFTSLFEPPITEILVVQRKTIRNVNHQPVFVVIANNGKDKVVNFNEWEQAKENEPMVLIRYKDGLTPNIVTSLFFACVTAIVAFGLVGHILTNNWFQKRYPFKFWDSISISDYKKLVP